MSQELIYKVALSKLPNIGPVNAKALMSHFGSAMEVFKAKKKDLLKVPGIGPSKWPSLENKDVFLAAEREIDYAIKHNIQIFFYIDEGYPRRLRHFDQSPIILYYKGQPILNSDRTIGVVGTRNPTELGKIQTEKLIEGAGPLGAVVISGLAFGVDSIAHKKCVDLNIPTVGVLGHGLDIIYPNEHRVIASRMLEHGGLLTEFGIDSKPDKQNFPMRNRIIAALSDATVVVESKAKGGSIITAEFANEFNKDVFAFPGRPNDEYAAGCNGLIKRNKAHLIESIDDVKYIMRWDEIDQSKVIQGSLFNDYSEDEQQIIDVLKNHKELAIDDLSAHMTMTPSALASLLLQLEFKGAVRTMPGKRYMLNY